MHKTDDTRTFNGKKYRYLCWANNKSSVDWFKQRAKLGGHLMRVTKGIGRAQHGYDIWVR